MILLEVYEDWVYLKLKQTHDYYTEIIHIVKKRNLSFWYIIIFNIRMDYYHSASFFPISKT